VDQVYRCPKCQSANVGKEVLSLRKTKREDPQRYGDIDGWDAPLGRVAGDDVCLDCGHKWVNLPWVDIPTAQSK